MLPVPRMPQRSRLLMGDTIAAGVASSTRLIRGRRREIYQNVQPSVPAWFYKCMKNKSLWPHEHPGLDPVLLCAAWVRRLDRLPYASHTAAPRRGGQRDRINGTVVKV